jgi:hypothetical protein
MKKILSALVLLSFLAVLAVPAMVSAQEGAPDSCEVTKSAVADLGGIDCPSSGDCPFDSDTYDCGMCCLMNAIYTVTDWIFVILIAIVAIMVLWGAFTLLTAGGSPEKQNTGRNYIIWAMVGMVVALLAKAIPAIVRAVMGL